MLLGKGIPRGSRGNQGGAAGGGGEAETVIRLLRPILPMYSTLFAIGAGFAIGWQLATISSKLVWGLVFAVMATAGEMLFRSDSFTIYILGGHSRLTYFGMSLIWNVLTIALVAGAVTFAKNIF